MKQRLLLWLLDTANDSPPTLGKREFYAIKEKLLSRYGVRDGEDVQYIERECWHCSQEGDCYRCGGTGIYESVWVRLERWRWGKHVFHRPAGRLLKPPPGWSLDRVVKGYVRHKTPKYYLSAEAWYWLALIYDRPAFRRTFGHTGYCGPKRTPLVILGTWLFWWRSLRAKWEWRRWLRTPRDNCYFNSLEHSCPVGITQRHVLQHQLIDAEAENEALRGVLREARRTLDREWKPFAHAHTCSSLMYTGGPCDCLMARVDALLSSTPSPEGK